MERHRNPPSAPIEVQWSGRPLDADQRATHFRRRLCRHLERRQQDQARRAAPADGHRRHGQRLRPVRCRRPSGCRQRPLRRPGSGTPSRRCPRAQLRGDHPRLHRHRAVGQGAGGERRAMGQGPPRPPPKPECVAVRDAARRRPLGARVGAPDRPTAAMSASGPTSRRSRSRSSGCWPRSIPWPTVSPCSTPRIGCVYYNKGFMDDSASRHFPDPRGHTFEEIIRAFAYNDVTAVPALLDRGAWIKQRVERHRNPADEPFEQQMTRRQVVSRLRAAHGRWRLPRHLDRHHPR